MSRVHPRHSTIQHWLESRGTVLPSLHGCTWHIETCCSSVDAPSLLLVLQFGIYYLTIWMRNPGVGPDQFWRNLKPTCFISVSLEVFLRIPIRISKPDDVCALLCRHHSSSAALVGPPLVIEHSRSPAPKVFGTVCHSTLRLHPHCLSSAAASRLTSFGAVSRNIFLSCIVPAQWQCHFGHYNQFCIVLYCIVRVQQRSSTKCCNTVSPTDM